MLFNIQSHHITSEKLDIFLTVVILNRSFYFIKTGIKYIISNGNFSEKYLKSLKSTNPRLKIWYSNANRSNASYYQEVLNMIFI